MSGEQKQEQSTNEANIHVVRVEFGKTEPPVFEEFVKPGKDWVNWGKNNDYPDQLHELYENSSYHSALVSGAAHYIGGGGWVIDETDQEEAKTIKAQKFIDNDADEEDLHDILEQVALDIKMHGGFAVQGWWSEASGEIARISYLDVDKIRPHKADKEGNIPPFVFYSDDWSARSQNEKTGFKKLTLFDSNTKKGTFVYFYIEPRKGKGKKQLPKPDYIGGIKSIKTDVEVTDYHMMLADTEFTGGTMIYLANGVPDTDEKKKEVEKKLKKKHSRKGDAENIVIAFGNGPDQKPEIIPLQGNNLDSRFLGLDTSTQQKIFTAHHCTNPMLFGIKTEGQLGGRTELIESNELYQNTYVNVKQRRIERVFNHLASFNGLEGMFTIAEVQPIGIELPMSESTLAQVLDRDELRNAAADKFGIELADNVPSFSFSKEEGDIVVFSHYGRQRKDCKIVKRTPMPDANVKTTLMSEVGILKSFATGIENDVLSLLAENPGINATEIARSINRPLDEITRVLDDLTERGWIEDLEVTDSGQSEIENPLNIEVLYSYEVRPDLGAEVIDTTRDFCRSLIALDRLYTRQEINQISGLVGRDVWRFRGGWYHNQSGQNTPYCRHIWVQNIVQTNG